MTRCSELAQKMNPMRKFDLSHKSIIRTPTLASKKPQGVEICESLRPDDNTQGNIWPI